MSMSYIKHKKGMLQDNMSCVFFLEDIDHESSKAWVESKAFKLCLKLN